MNSEPSFLEIITANFAAGETKLFALSGKYFELIALPGVVDVRLVDLNGAQRGVMRSAGASFYIGSAGYDTIEMTSPTAQTVRFAFGTAEAGTRSTSGTVSVNDNEVLRSTEGRAFGGGAQNPASAGFVSFVQLWNPAGSGRNLFVTGIHARTQSGVVLVGRDQAPQNAPFNVPSKATSGAASVGEIRVLAGSATTTTMYQAENASGIVWEPAQPLIVTPGWGICVHQNAVNLAVRAHFDFFEQPA